MLPLTTHTHIGTLNKSVILPPKDCKHEHMPPSYDHYHGGVEQPPPHHYPMIEPGEQYPPPPPMHMMHSDDDELAEKPTIDTNRGGNYVGNKH